MKSLTRFWTLGAAIDRAGFDGRYGARARQLANARKRLRRVLTVRGTLA